MTESINYEAVCRTAPATPGLLNTPKCKDDHISFQGVVLPGLALGSLLARVKSAMDR